MQHDIRPNDWLTVIAGLDYEKSGYENQEPLDAFQGNYEPVRYEFEWDGWDAFSKLQFSFLDDTLMLDVGGRYNHPEEFDDSLIWELSGAYIVKSVDFKVHAHIGAGYRTPSLYEVNGGYLSMGEFIKVGNPELEPEESISYEIGADQFLMDKKINIGATYFKIDFDDLVFYDLSTSQYRNASQARSEGIESYLHVKPCSYFKMSVAYTYMDSEKKTDQNAKWTRKENLPRNKLNLTASIYPIDNLTLWGRLKWQDDTTVSLYDPSFNSVPWNEDATVTVDASVTYKINSYFDIWLRAENLFDEDYTQGGWTMPGRWIYGGVKFAF